jgi:hypothetical protein
VYEVVPAAGAKMFTQVNMGFIHPQAQSVACSNTNVVVVN